MGLTQGNLFKSICSPPGGPTILWQRGRLRTSPTNIRGPRLTIPSTLALILQAACRITFSLWLPWLFSHSHIQITAVVPTFSSQKLADASPKRHLRNTSTSTMFTLIFKPIPESRIHMAFPRFTRNKSLDKIGHSAGARLKPSGSRAFQGLEPARPIPQICKNRAPQFPSHDPPNARFHVNWWEGECPSKPHLVNSACFGRGKPMEIIQPPL